MKRTNVIIIAVFVSLLAAQLARAQGPVGGALATLAAATAQAEYGRAARQAGFAAATSAAVQAQAAASATAQAGAAEADRAQATATAQAMSQAASATAQSIRQDAGATATADALEVAATMEALGQAQAARATGDAQAAAATAAVYAVGLAERKEFGRMVSRLVELAVAFVLAAAMVAWVWIVLTRRARGRATVARWETSDGRVVIDAWPVMLPAPDDAVPEVRVVNDQGSIDRLREWWEGGDEQ